jgi:hypothetical protein
VQISEQLYINFGGEERSQAGTIEVTKIRNIAGQVSRNPVVSGASLAVPCENIRTIFKEVSKFGLT